MTTFIEDVLKDLQESGVSIDDKFFVVPSKRAGIFIKSHLIKIFKQTSFVPQIISIEDFVKELSGLKLITSTEQLFIFYSTYKKITPKEKIESFDSFAKWASILLQDFNEIDRHLVDEHTIFDYLGAIKETEHWSLNPSKAEFIENYLNFWKNLKQYYAAYTNDLMSAGIGYQGLIYKQAVEQIESYIDLNSKQQHVFLGFNALNKAESYIIQALLQANLAHIYWDIDQLFFEDPMHDAGLFIRSYKNNWSFYKSNSFNWVTTHYTKQKSIQVIGVPKQVGQAKYIGQLLDEINAKSAELKQTAIVLGDESLIGPLLNSIPKSVDSINVTMGFPLTSAPLSTLFERLFYMHLKPGANYYYKDVLSVLASKEVQLILKDNSSNLATILSEDINTNNILFISHKELKALTPKKTEIIDLLFSEWTTSHQAISSCKELIMLIKANLKKLGNEMMFEYLYRFNKLFNELERLNDTYNYFESLSSLHSIYKELLKSETMDFKGEPLEGLQIMGMLESRVLDFETVIISSVNEGLLPAGKTNNSFIPFDVKLENQLPTYKEKDAVYTYHFYRLLQRAKNVYIIYNTELDTLTGGEPSRFINQLKLEGVHNIMHKIASPQVPSFTKSLKQVSKTNEIMLAIKELSKKGFSPSSLSSYIRNPIDFYYQKVLGVKDFDAVEETIAANTLGSVIHHTLEDFYKPLVGEHLTKLELGDLLPKIPKTVEGHFHDLYKQGDLSQGKNLIILEVAKRYIYNFIQTEINHINDGATIKILGIEKDFKVELKISEIDYPLVLKGKIDRIDMFNGTTRVIDYKTGYVEQNKVEIINWDDLTLDYDKYNKPFQLLTYCYALHLSKEISFPVTSGIISFKNLQKGYLPFSKKDKAGKGARKESLITDETLINYRSQLNRLVLEIFNPNVPFTEKELDNDYSNELNFR